MSTRTRDATIEALEDPRAVLLALLVVASAIAGVGLATATPSTEIPVGIAASSGISMTPTYGTSGLALYADVGELEEDDVVIFEDRSSGRYMMHRVVGATEEGVVTQGDAYTSTDQELGRSYVTEDTRVGEVLVVVDETGVHLPSL